MAIAIVYMRDYLVAQVLIVSSSTILVMILLGISHPLGDLANNYKELLNEYVIILIMDLLLCSSDPSLDIDARPMIGWCIVGILGLSISLS